MRKAYIYALVSSDDQNHFRYVGVTVDPKSRLDTHVKDTFSDKAFEINPHKINWQRKVINNFQTIEMILTTEFISEKEAFEAEDEAIELYKFEGHKLTNIAPGGQGGILFSDPDELQAFYDRRAEITRSPETRANMSKAALENWSNPEYHTRLVKALQDSMTPEVRSRINESNRKRNQDRIAHGELLDPEMLALRGQKISRAGKKYFEEPENRAKTAKATTSMWASLSPEQKANRAYKAKMTARYNKANKNGWVLKLTPVTEKECNENSQP